MFLPKHPWKATGRAVRALFDPTRPLLAQVVVTRRCNLTCGYCNEYDDFSPPVPLEDLLARVDHLAALGTVVVTLTGGEPLLHPQLDQIIRRVVEHGMVCTSISNAYPITERWIKRLNDAGLSLMQISIDNLEPNDVSVKSLSKIQPKLELLRDHAKFGVNINAVLGSCNPQETRKLVSVVRDLGFFMTVGLLHDHQGMLDTGLVGNELSVLYGEIRQQSHKSFFHRFGEGWEDAMIKDGISDWKCRAGARYLYVDEFGSVSYCSQRRGTPGVPLLSYTSERMEREYQTIKGCEKACTIACVRRASSMDGWRSYSLVSEDQPLRLPVVN